MARMYPETPLSPIESGAERRLFELLRTELPDRYAVLHSVKWLRRKPHRDFDGEADFLILHPDYGGLILEVKGGEILREPLSTRWYSRNRHGALNQISNPFDQAKGAMYDLQEIFRLAHPELQLADSIKRAVAFPDVALRNRDLGPDAPRWLILDSADLQTLETSLLRAWKPSTNAAIGPEGVAAAVQLLSPALELRRPGLGAEIAEEREAFIRLTNDQMRLLDFVAGHRRVAIRGVAGSGKTILALEVARRLAMQGYRVLYTCFNEALAGWARDALYRQLEGKAEGVAVTHYHELAEDFARRSGVTLPGEAEREADAATYYNETLPQLLSDAVDALPDRFDAIIVDEGQDFADIWWLSLESLLSDPDDGVFYLFYDPDQTVYTGRSTSALPLPEPHFQLAHNCRSTQNIHNLAFRYSAAEEAATCLGPAGRPPEIVPADEGRELDALRKVLHRLVHDEGVRLEHMIVITPRSQQRSVLTEGARLGNFTLSWGECGPNQVRATSIAKFKGLESDVVILVELDQAYYQTRSALIHVAITRARHHVVVIGSLPEPAGI
ncbi:MAG: NERD domain-containing protein [Thermomicrobiales bacterium]